MDDEKDKERLATREYERGHRDGIQGKEYDDGRSATEYFTLGPTGHKTDSKSYSEGFSDGKEDGKK